MVIKKQRTNKIVEAICIIETCRRPFPKFKQKNKSNGSLIARPSRSKTCSKKCSREYIRLIGLKSSQKINARNRLKKCQN